MEIIGTVKKILDLQVYKNNFKKRELLLKTEEQYPQILRIEFILDKTKLLNSFKKDDKIKIFINLKGKKWTTKTGETRFFNYIQGWKIESQIETKRSNPIYKKRENQIEKKRDNQLGTNYARKKYQPKYQTK